MNETIQKEHLQRGLSNRHLQLIAIGGAIGTGLFMGSGKLAHASGPSILLVYMVLGFFLFFTMRALGEMLLNNLNYKTFGDVAKDYLGPWAGFFTSWTYWLIWVSACIADIVAIVGYVHFFNKDIPFWIPALIVTAILMLLNLQPVKWFGETEFWFALIKIVAIVGLLLVGGWMIVSGFTSPSGVKASLGNLWEHEGFFPKGVHGFLLGFQMGVFSFIGVEMVGTAAAETKDPHKNLPRAVNSIMVRITIFYVGALAVILSITPWNLLDPKQSPFVATLSLAGLGLAAVIINLVVLTSATSSANSGIYSTARMMFTLAKDGHSVKAFGKISSNGVPRNAAMFSAGLTILAIPLMMNDNLLDAFTTVSTVCAMLILFVWSIIMISYLKYRKTSPELHTASKFKMPLSGFMPYLVLAFFAALYVTLLLAEDTRLPALLTPIWFVLLGAAWAWRRKALLAAGLPLTQSIPTVQPKTHDEK
ncbi:MAG: amino acid permease [Microbacteriaceae bacterium]|nr:amino acid permease [Microbacteriaceae bacterium]